jgi:cruciform cutting endonuclease 1
MAPRKPTVTTKALQALLTRIGSASSGTKNVLLTRVQRDIQRPGLFSIHHDRSAQHVNVKDRKLRVMSIDMGIKNLAFCDAEISYLAVDSASLPRRLDATMEILRWRKIDLIESGSPVNDESQDDEEAAENAEEGENPYSLTNLSQTAYRLITDEVLSVRPDVILIEKQRWRSGGGSAVQQWTVRVNTLEAMLWAILEALKKDRNISTKEPKKGNGKDSYTVFAVDPKRVGQYWLVQHARALQKSNEDALAFDVSALLKQSNPSTADEAKTFPKKPSRSKAEKSAKIALLRSWLTDTTMSTTPSTPASMPRIAFKMSDEAETIRQALLPKPRTVKATRQSQSKPKSKSKATESTDLVSDIPAVDIKKLDDITDCVLQAAAWVAWEGNRAQLATILERDGGGGKTNPPITEEEILKMMEKIEEL